jgi:hypothetical protein
VLVTQRRGLYWVPTQRPGTLSVQQVYVPNVVAQQVPQTSYVQKVVAVEKPVTVTRYVDEVVTRQVPVQVCRVEEEVQVRQVPYTVQKPITERVECKVPVQTCRWEQQEVVRRVPVTTTRWEYEERVEQVQVQVQRTVAEVREIQVPHTQCKWVPHVTTRYRPRTVMMRVPIGETVISSTTTTRVISPPAETMQAVGPSQAETSGAAADSPPGLKPGEVKEEQSLLKEAAPGAETNGGAPKNGGEPTNGGEAKNGVDNGAPPQPNEGEGAELNDAKGNGPTA